MRRNGKVEKNMHKGGSRSNEKNTKVCVLYSSVQKGGTRILRHRVTVYICWSICILCIRIISDRFVTKS